MRIQHNIMAMNAYRNFGNNTSALSKNLEKLSSGYKINRAGDDAAGLAISEKMRAQITGLKAATKNVKDGISLVKTAEGALQEVHDMLNRMDYLATQSANGTYDNAVDRANLQKEVDSLKKEINRISDSANFNGQKLLNGELYAGQTVTATQAANGGTNPAVNLSISSVAFKDANGDLKNLTFKISEGDTGTGVTADGTVTLKLDTKNSANGMTAADVQAAIRQLANEGAIADNESLKAALQSVTVTGDTIAKTNDGIKTEITVQAQAVDPNNKPMQLQIGDTSQEYDQLSVSIKDLDTTGLGIADLDISTPEGAAAAIDKIKAAINTVSSTRGDLGAIQNRLEHTQNNLSVMTENIQDAESTIRDTDVAEEMMAYTKNNILIQSAQAMLAQANQVPQGVLQLMQ